MENRDNQSPEISQQNQQQPTSQDGGSSTGSTPPTGGQNETDGSELGQNGQSSNPGQPGGAFDSQQPSETGQADYGQSGQSDTLTQQRSDVEGSGGQTPEMGSESGFIGQQGGTDPSSELVEDEQDFEKDGQGSIEGQ